MRCSVIETRIWKDIFFQTMDFENSKTIMYIQMQRKISCLFKLTEKDTMDRMVDAKKKKTHILKLQHDMIHYHKVAQTVSSAISNRI